MRHELELHDLNFYLAGTTVSPVRHWLTWYQRGGEQRLEPTTFPHSPLSAVRATTLPHSPLSGATEAAR